MRVLMKKRKSDYLLFMITISAILISGCADSGERRAEESAKAFVERNVVFHIENRTVSNPYVQVVERRKDGANYVFEMIATTTGEERIKSAKVSVVADRRGNVLMFNGKSTSLPPN